MSVRFSRRYLFSGLEGRDELFSVKLLKYPMGVQVRSPYDRSVRPYVAFVLRRLPVCDDAGILVGVVRTVAEGPGHPCEPKDAFKHRHLIYRSVSVLLIAPVHYPFCGTGRLYTLRFHCSHHVTVMVGVARLGDKGMYHYVRCRRRAHVHELYSACRYDRVSCEKDYASTLFCPAHPVQCLVRKAETSFRSHGAYRLEHLLPYVVGTKAVFVMEHLPYFLRIPYSGYAPCHAEPIPFRHEQLSDWGRIPCIVSVTGKHRLHRLVRKAGHLAACTVVHQRAGFYGHLPCNRFIVQTECLHRVAHFAFVHGADTLDGQLHRRLRQCGLQSAIHQFGDRSLHAGRRDDDSYAALTLYRLQSLADETRLAGILFVQDVQVFVDGLDRGICKSAVTFSSGPHDSTSGHGVRKRTQFVQDLLKGRILVSKVRLAVSGVEGTGSRR